jgi:ATP-dependent Clp protease adaptor protein ClpS
MTSLSATKQDTHLVTKPKTEVTEPSSYKVLLHNDDYTPMDFVVKVLISIFHKDPEAAEIIMMDVHQKGWGVCGIYPLEIAEMKASQVVQESVKAGFPLKCTVERSF